MNARVMALAGLAAILLAAGVANAQTHAPWPTNWNNWNDPALLVHVGDPGNAGELSGAVGYGGERICGAVPYAYNIGKYEVTAGQYAAFLNAVAKSDTYGLYNTLMDTANDQYGCNIKRIGSSGSYAYSVASDWANRPVNYVSWGDAARFANWLQNGQPTGTQDLTTTEDGAYYLNGATSNVQLLAVSRKANWTWAITSEDEWYKAAY
jgi:formylglycine-generating enzyme